MTLCDLSIGNTGTITFVESDDRALRRHILDMGLTPGTQVTVVKAAPMGDPLELTVRGYSLTLRKADAAKIGIVPCASEKPTAPAVPRRPVAHTGIGETAYRPRRGGSEIPAGRPLRFALAGNQNCGKTTLFNQLTGSNQHVGNFPGVTVDRKDGAMRHHPEATVTDLPGIYSLSPYTSEEIVTRQFLLEDKPDGIINIIDATNIERNLLLTLQLIELDIPMVIALNMMDEVRAGGGTIRVNGLEAALGIPVIPIAAAKNEGVSELAEHAVNVARFCEKPGRMDFCDKNAGGNMGAVHRCIHAVVHLIEDHALRADIPVRFAASKIVEGDERILAALKLDKNEAEAVEHIVSQMETECGKDREAALADTRFSFIEKLCADWVVKPRESREHKRSRRIDRILTGRYTAMPAFIAIMALVFYLTFGPIGGTLSDLMELGIDRLTALCDHLLTLYGINPVVHSLIIKGIFAGVGSVLSFLPVIVVLFFFLSILEDSGYMARVAFIMDRLLRRFGLSGRSFVPMLIGFGCSVPAIMATRTLPSERDRRMTVFLTPFMSCSAKLPIYALFTAAFFPDHAVLVMIGLYLIGIAVGILFALLMKNTAFKGEPVPFVMELPNYRMPSAKSVLKLICEKAKDYLTKAFTIIFLASIVIWFLQSFDLRLNAVSDPADSLLAGISGAIAPLFAPLGLGDWRISTALITGFTAKESVVSTLTVLLGSTDALHTLFTPLTAFTFLIFSLLYTPCVAAIAAVKRELGRRYAVTVVFLQCAVAWLAAFAVHAVGSLF